MMGVTEERKEPKAVQDLTDAMLLEHRTRALEEIQRVVRLGPSNFDSRFERILSLAGDALRE